MESSLDTGWNAAAVRRAVRLICSHSSRIEDNQATARMLRLIWDIAQRRGATTEVFQLPGTMPLLTIGNGPVLLLTHLDDPHPLAQVNDVGPPSITANVVTAPGITRTAGVLAALGAYLTDDALASEITLVIETDRHQNSQSFGLWLDNAEHHNTAAIYDVVDLPVPAPAVFMAATGTVLLRIHLQLKSAVVERQYGGVQPDVGHLLAAAISSLKSVDGEVLVPGFYDDVITPEPEGLAAIERISPTVGRWIAPETGQSVDGISASHVTLGAFVAPSLVVREIASHGLGPYLATSATAIIEAQVMPGQNAHSIGRAISDAIASRLPSATIQTILLRQPSRSTHNADNFFEIATVYPSAPGPSPAGILAGFGIPALGFSTTWRDPDTMPESVHLATIDDGSRMIQRLIKQLIQIDSEPA